MSFEYTHVLRVETYFNKFTKKWTAQLGLLEVQGAYNSREIWRKAPETESDTEGAAIAKAEGLWNREFRGLALALGYEVTIERLMAKGRTK